jgi:hypothetical protein
MPSDAQECRTATDTDRAPWPSITLALVLVLGMVAAAVSAVQRGEHTGPRDLTILAADGASVTVDGVPSRIPVIEGVHAYSVTPGAHMLRLETAGEPPVERSVDVPAGIGPLMIELRVAPGGGLDIGFY